ncbi:hypothetical protein HNY73_016327 [Argiope bruennichi]|uniref:Uncharacterized protein n=1 Tax=Argiope bruennichi TaxID=94029 RepID=A0A8T0EIH0_ARGBR|nr:hypothetical protein HNY73_016327 [Argiope bruennichi]
MAEKEFSRVGISFFLLLITSHFFTDGADENEIETVKSENNAICRLRLTGLVAKRFYASLDEIHQYDPIPVDSLLCGNLHNGVFHGLSTLKNGSDINVYCDGEKVILTCLLTMDDVSIKYEWERKLFFTFSGSVWTKFRAIQFQLEVSLNTINGVKMDALNIQQTKLEGSKFGFSGMGPLNPFIKILGNMVLRLWKRRITDKVEELLQSSLESELKKLEATW